MGTTLKRHRNVLSCTSSRPLKGVIGQSNRDHLSIFMSIVPSIKYHQIPLNTTNSDLMVE